MKTLRHIKCISTRTLLACILPFFTSNVTVPDATIRLYFTLEDAQKKLHRSRQCATRIFRDLEYSSLINRRKQGLGKPAVITLNHPADTKLIVKEADTHVG